jgi:hypothetical protein
VRRWGVRSRILFGVAAWLLGAATATTGSLLAVSLLGQGITGNSAQLLTQDTVNRALASEAAQGPVPGARPGSPSATAPGVPSRSQPAVTASPVTTPASSTPTSVATTARPPAVPSSSSSSSPAPPPSSGGAVLTSAGGEAVATCQGADAYLISWSPRQGYQVGDVIRGPALTARVTFESHANRVTMVVTCSAGTPSATSHTWAGDE